MNYGVIDPRLWDDDKIPDLSDPAFRVWIFLLTSRHAMRLPGLVVISAAGIAEDMARPRAYVSKALAELIKAQVCQLDERRRLIRVPRAPRYNPPGNGNVIKAWFSAWNLIPESALKYAHIESLKEVCQDRSENHRSAWKSTFAKVSSNLLNGSGNGSSNHTPNRLPNGSAIDPVTDPDPDPDPERARRANGRPEPQLDLTPIATDEDFEALYALYPRHEGKADGIEKCRSNFRDRVLYEQLLVATKNYAALVQTEKRERKHVLIFSTFVNGRWTDYRNGTGSKNPEPVRPEYIAWSEKKKALELADGK